MRATAVVRLHRTNLPAGIPPGSLLRAIADKRVVRSRPGLKRCAVVSQPPGCGDMRFGSAPVLSVSTHGRSRDPAFRFAARLRGERVPRHRGVRQPYDDSRNAIRCCAGWTYYKVTICPDLLWASFASL